MRTLERIKYLCEKNGISLMKLEKELGFGNGSLARTNDAVRADRVLAIAKYFSVPVEYVLGEDEYLDFLNIEKGAMYARTVKKLQALAPEDRELVLTLIERLSR